MPRLASLVLSLSLPLLSFTALSQSAPLPGPTASKSSLSKPAAAKSSRNAPLPDSAIHNPTLWHNPGKIEALDLFGGQGGRRKAPVEPFTFLNEDTDGTNPKFDVRDARGKKWRVKLGEEARPEVVASRLLWAVGYYVNDDYVLEAADIPGIRLSRGGDDTKKGHIREARFSRKPGGQDKIGTWKWGENPFTGTREFNGLRVMMAVMNNWDLKDENNSVYSDKKSGKQIFLVNDVGATFGTNGLSWTKARSKGNIGSFRESKFITRVSDTDVDFATPKQPNFLIGAVNPKQYAMRIDLDWIGNKIPRNDARWMGEMLGRLSHKQLRDAFRAGHFPTDQIDAYVEIVENRIHELKEL
ncbi:hypothetical protein [Terriglobus albidus]|uniref:hypothetical protein n=1 Tax=Terriglobus albidus TaxID=1592106 RepID=UPI0021E0414D|nr:hypothetical protein [Terriglobus albidus]